MDLVWEGVREAFWMLVRNEGDVYGIARRSLYVSGFATAIALVIGVGLGAAIAFNQFPGKVIVLALVNTGMGLPPVVVGLVISIMLWRSGPLGELGWIYTTKAMIIAQAIIATPIVIGFTAASLSSLHPRLRQQVYALGASRLQMLWVLVNEVRLPLLAAIMAGFGAAISEVGASVMVGGNLTGETRVMTGAILLENSRGHFGAALAFGIILLAMMVAVNALITWVQVGARRDVQAPADRGAIRPPMATMQTWSRG
jgi:tungstate transport system permease protein